MRSVSCTGMDFFRTVVLIQFSLPELHPNHVKWAVTNGSSKYMVLTDLTFIISEEPLG